MQLNHVELISYSNGPEGVGILACLDNCFKASKASSTDSWLRPLSSAARRMLRAFLLQPKWYGSKKGQQQVLEAAALGFLLRLPIFEPAGVEGGNETFRTLEAARFVVPTDLQPAPAAWASIIDGEAFVGAASADERCVLLQHIQLAEISKAQLYRSELFGRVAALRPVARDAMFLQLLQELPLLQHSDPTFSRDLGALKFVSTSNGELKAPRDVYDPRNSDLLLLLDPGSDFPSALFAPALDALQQLGMRTAAGRGTILQSAQSVEQLAATEPDKALARGRALLAYLEVEIPAIASQSGRRIKGTNPNPLDRLFSRQVPHQVMLLQK